MTLKVSGRQARNSTEVECSFCILEGLYEEAPAKLEPSSVERMHCAYSETVSLFLRKVICGEKRLEIPGSQQRGVVSKF